MKKIFCDRCGNKMDDYDTWYIRNDVDERFCWVIIKLESKHKDEKPDICFPCYTELVLKLAERIPELLKKEATDIELGRKIDKRMKED